ncbi:MAG: D-alanyl-D-alanine carboxypeptidase family protein [Bacilli bacterium]
MTFYCFLVTATDAAVAMAEKIGGSTTNFVKMMNDKCSELGCKNTNFVNVHGLDEENHYSCAYDMSLMAKELLKHQDILRFTSTYEEYLNKPDGTKIWLVNTNKLVRFMPGVDGLKTGFTANAGYCLTATGIRNDIRFISVVMGEGNTNLRSEDTTNMLNYGFNNYKLNKVVDYNTNIGKVKVDKGKLDEANLLIKEEIIELKSINDELKTYDYQVDVSKVKAPVKNGDVVGKLKVLDNGETLYEVELTIKEDVPKSTFFDILKDNFKTIFCGWK